VPAGLNWDLWLGPAPERPFKRGLFSGAEMVSLVDFGNGTMSDLGSHWNESAVLALKTAIAAHHRGRRSASACRDRAASMHATYEYGARGELPPVKLTWHQGEDKPEIWTNGGIPKWDSGALFIGDKGMVLSDLRQVCAAAGEGLRRLSAPRAEYRAVAGASPGMDQRLQDRLPDAGQLRVCRLADRGESPRECRLSRGKEAGVGSGEVARANVAGKRIVSFT